MHTYYGDVWGNISFLTFIMILPKMYSSVDEQTAKAQAKQKWFAGLLYKLRDAYYKDVKMR